VQKKAFTLIEIIITVLLVGILAAAVIPRLGGMDVIDRLRARAIAHEIAVDMGYARRLAITHSEDYAIQFDFALGTYDILTGVPLQSIGKDFPKAVPQRVTLSGTNQFTFERLGNTTAGGTVQVSGSTQIFNITVDAVTGSVRMH